MPRHRFAFLAAVLILLPLLASRSVMAEDVVQTTRQGVILDLGGALGLGDRNSFDLMAGPVWKGSIFRVGVLAGFGMVNETGDDTVHMGGVNTSSTSQNFYWVQKDAKIDDFKRFYLLPQLELSIPLSSWAYLTVGGGMGPVWISDVNSRMVGGGLPIEDNPGLLVRATMGLDFLPVLVGTKFELGMESHSYSIFRNGVEHSFSDPKFLIALVVDRFFPIGEPVPVGGQSFKAASAPRVQPGRSAVQIQDSSKTGAVEAGSRSPESILQVVRANIGDFQRIYQQCLNERPGIQGRIGFMFTIAPAGEIIQVKIVSTETGDPELDQRLKERVRAMKFPPIDRGNVTVTYSFVLDH